MGERRDKKGMNGVEETRERRFVGFPKLLHHQSTLQSFKKGQLHLFLQLFIDTHTNSCTYSPTHHILYVLCAHHYGQMHSLQGLCR